MCTCNTLYSFQELAIGQGNIDKFPQVTQYYMCKLYTVCYPVLLLLATSTDITQQKGMLQLHVYIGVNYCYNGYSTPLNQHWENTGLHPGLFYTETFYRDTPSWPALYMYTS